ncbi:MAG: universal stress protein [Vulcanisaeta sp.]|jgi:nucleotide-binding universal stress UspA family protein|uniref:UspA domain protein n=1 Tax=Vulcanisaeta moutnovskia (strain 768-28) TaxID=985053 RepID=F0QV71_VULM7|nr:universal stress protein [Vulcanisaeta moutnovskia]ADY00803.1 UspA domain protein [Vulcanisaeta moutnovskia 768-28]
MSLITKILVGFDGSKAGEKALDYAINIAKTFNAKLYILHVIEEGKIAVAPDSSMYPALIETMERQGRDLLSKAVDRAKSLGVNAEGLLEVGTDAADTIISIANNLNVDLIIVGSRGLKGLTRFLLGSVSEKVVRYANKPVLVIH